MEGWEDQRALERSYLFHEAKIIFIQIDGYFLYN